MVGGSDRVGVGGVSDRLGWWARGGCYCEY